MHAATHIHGVVYPVKLTVHPLHLCTQQQTPSVSRPPQPSPAPPVELLDPQTFWEQRRNKILLYGCVTNSTVLVILVRDLVYS